MSARRAVPADEQATQIHGTCVAFGAAGLLLRGPSGSGKSDLALRLIDAGARLVADDRVDLSRARDGGLMARAPSPLSGRMEVRGIGILPVPSVAAARLALVADLVLPGEVERLPEAARAEYLGVALPCIAIAPFESSAAAKLRLAVQGLGPDIMRGDGT